MVAIVCLPKLADWQLRNNMLKLRPFNFTQEDYSAITAIHQTSYADSHARTTDYKRIDDYWSKAEYDWARSVAEWDGEVVGYGIYTRTLWLATPDLYLVGGLTHPDFRKRGIASAYWQHLTENVLPQRKISGLLADTRSDVPGGVSFLEKRGFKRSMTTTHSVIDLSSFDHTHFAERRAAIDKRGIEIKSISALIESDPDHIEKLIELDFMMKEDEPFEEAPVKLSAETFRTYYMSDDDFYPEGWFIAVDGDKYIGWTAVCPNMNDAETMHGGISVIDRDYRRLGLATAMKAHTLHHAQTIGAKQITTSNASTNPMLQINLKLGYVPQYDRHEYKKLM